MSSTFMDDSEWYSSYYADLERKSREEFENLISRVKDFVRCRKELEDRDLKDREDDVSKLISGKLERLSIPDVQVHEDCRIHRLSDADIRNILGRMKDPKSLYTCELVCKRWNAIARDVWLSKRKLTHKKSFYALYADDSVEAREKLFSLLKKCPELREFCANLYLDEVTFFIIGNCCPKIEKLILPEAKIKKGSLKSLAEYCPQLKTLHLPQCEYLTEEDLEDFLKVANGLESLNLQSSVMGNIHITGECFHHLSMMKLLNVRECSKLTEASIIKLAEKCSSSLVSLGIGPISRRSLSVICQSLPNLIVLAISRIEERTDSGNIGLITSCRLEKLVLLRIDGPCESFIHDGKWMPRDINIEGEFVKMIKSAKKLRKLFITKCNWLNDDVISLIPTFCEEIECLNVSSSQMTDEGLVSLLKFKSLVKLWLCYTKVTDEGVMKVLTGCPNLDLLGLDGCSSVSIVTLFNAYDLTRQGLLNKQLVILYKDNVIRINTIENREDIQNYDYDDDDYNMSSRDADFYCGSD